MKRHTNHSIILQAMVLHGVRWEPFLGTPFRGELCFDGMRYSTELDRFGCPIIPMPLFIKLIPLTKAFDFQPKTTIDTPKPYVTYETDP